MGLNDCFKVGNLMIKRIKNYFKSTFVRYIVSYLLLMALLVGGLTVYMYSYYRSSVYDSTISAETSLSWQLKYSADSYFNSLSALARLSSILRSEGEIEAELTELTQEDGRSAFLYAPRESRVYTAYGAQSAQQWLSTLNYEQYSRSELRSALFEAEDFALLPAQPVTVDGAEGRMLTVVIPAANGGSVIGLIPESALLTPEASDDSESNRYVIYEGAVCARREEFKISESRVLEAGTSLNRAVNEVRNLQGVNYLFIAMPGDVSGMTYVSVQPLNGIRVKAAGVWLGFMAVLLAIAIPCTLFMVLISRKNLAPILEMGKHFGARDEKYSDDISAIVSGIEELEGQNREIQYSSLSARRHVYARSLVTGAYESAEAAREAASEIGLDIDKKNYVVLLVGAPRERRQDGYLDSLIALQTENTCCVGTDLMESNQFMLLCFADGEEAIEAYAAALMGEKLVKTLHLPVAVSAVHEELKEMSNAYLEATSAYESRFLMGENRLLRFSEISFAAARNEAGAQDYADDIRQALQKGDMDGVNRSLEKLKSDLSSKNMNLFSFRRVYNDIIGAILSQADEKNYSDVEIYDLFSLSGCRSVDELENVLRGVCESIVSARSPEAELPLIQRVMRIMTVNYTNSDFTLSQAAELAGISPVRLTGEFKAKMGMTPNDYLTMLRMEEAKKLLRLTDLAVGDVCRQAGYADASSFARRFKQYAGVTPLQYRQEAKKENNGSNGQADSGQRA